MPAYSLVRACMLDSKGVGWHQTPGWFHLKCIINCFEEKIWSLNCYCVVVCFFNWIGFLLKLYIYADKCCFKSILVPCTLFRLIPYAVIRVFTVECILKCVILLCYTGLFCLWFWEMYHPIPLFLTPLLFGTPKYGFCQVGIRSARCLTVLLLSGALLFCDN